MRAEHETPTDSDRPTNNAADSADVLLDATEDVRRTADGVRVTFNVDGERLGVPLSDDELLGGATTKVRARFWGAFDEQHDLDDGAWRQLRNAWEEQAASAAPEDR